MTLTCIALLSDCPHQHDKTRSLGRCSKQIPYTSAGLHNARRRWRWGISLHASSPLYSFKLESSAAHASGGSSD